MKKFIVLFVIALFLGGCITANVPVGAPIAPAPQEIKLTVNGAAVDKPDKIHRTMEVRNHELSLSGSCKVLGKKAYVSLTSISSYDAKDLWSDFKVLSGMDIDEVIIYMSNPGGAAFQGMGITDELRIFKERKIPITVEGRGLIASAAIPVFLMADHRIVSKYTIFMIHPAKLFKWGMFAEGLEDLQSQAKMINLLNSNYAESVAACSNVSKEEVLEMLKKDNWFTAEEAKKLGFVDEIK